jgi:hypothetical protein
MLCHIRLAPRRLAVHILKEVKQLFKLLGALREDMVSSIIFQTLTLGILN